ncbi:uncharacterized protein LOC131018785 [Salvia miltiorrhiza]|uniref:uncharacterized protein LOC131018785 n=1 Tax=Salvia miltiorrhiza TaxID=226208 RepID=UPI0025ABC9E9|nr:uncharacterized protein LOC131018785 [Salvia miltiorrhiza]
MDYSMIRAIVVSSRVAASPKVINVYWWPPIDDWIKVNTDGSALGAPGKITAGAFFRDKWSWVRGCFHIKGGIGFAFKAKLLAIITAIGIAHSRGWTKLWVEADSSYVVSLLETHSKQISHIYREGNQAADLMANPQRHEGWWPYAIDEIKHAVAMDMSSHSYICYK